jgi:hypothetical protein
MWSGEIAIRVREGLPELHWADVWNSARFATAQHTIEETAAQYTHLWPKPGQFVVGAFDLAARVFQAPGVWRGTMAIATALETCGTVHFEVVDKIMRNAVPGATVVLPAKLNSNFFSPLRHA